MASNNTLQVTVQAIDKASGTFQKVSKTMEGMKDAAQHATDGCSKTASALDNVSKVTDNIGSGMTKFVSLPLIGAGAAAAKMASDFDTALAKVSTIADTSRVSVNDLQQQIMDLSNETGESASAIAEATYNAISAGQDTADAVDFVATSTKLAKAGFTDSATAVDVLTTTLNAYGKKAGTAEEVSDKLIKTQNLGKTTVADLGASMGKVIPTANMYSVSLDNLMSAYVTTTKNGIATAESTTYINSMFNELGKSGTDVSNILKEETGKSFSQLMDSGKSLTDVLQIIQTHCEETGTSIGDVFSSQEAGKAAATLVQHAEDFSDAMTQMGESAGTMQEAYDKMDATPAEQLKKTLNSLKNDAITLGNSLLTVLGPAFSDISGFVKDASDKFQSLPPEMQDVIVKVGLVTAAAGPALKAVSGMTKGIAELAGGIGKLTGKGSAAETISDIGSAAGLSTGAVVGLGAAVAVTGEALFLYAAHSTDASKAAQAFADEASQVAAEVGKNTQSLAETTQSAFDTLEGFRVQSGVVNDLVSSIRNLQGQTELTADQQSDMLGYVTQLNSLYPELGLSVDGVTGKLTEESEARLANIDSMQKEAEAAAVESLLQDEYKKQIQTQIDLKKTKEEIAAAQEKVNEAEANRPKWDFMGETTGVQTANKALEELLATKSDLSVADLESQTAINDLTQYYEDNGLAAYSAGESTGNLAQAEETAAEGSGQLTEAQQELTEAYNEAREAAQKSIESQVGLFEKLELDTNTSVSSMTEALNSQSTVFQQYSDNMSTAMSYAQQSGSTSLQLLVQDIASMGVDGADEMAALAGAIEEASNGSSESLDSLVAAFDKREALEGQLAGMTATVQTGMQGVEDAARTGGENTAQAVAQGEQSQTGTVNQAAGQISDAADPDIDTTSPQTQANTMVNNVASAMIKGVAGIGAGALGLGIDTGFAAGISMGSGMVTSAIDSMMSSALSHVNSGISALRSAFASTSFSFNHYIAVPHFSMSGSFDARSHSVPSVGVSWYAKGAVLKAPTIFGMQGGRFLGGGEAGPEAVAPISTLQDYIRNAVGGGQTININMTVSGAENPEDWAARFARSFERQVRMA